MSMDNFNLNNMDIREIKGKKVYIVDKHNHVFPIWLHNSRVNNKIYTLVSFDYHTDTRKPFTSYAYDMVVNENIPYYQEHTFIENTINRIIEQINTDNLDSIIRLTIDRLKNDEHIMLSYRVGAINEFHIINCSNIYTDENGYYYKNDIQCKYCPNRLIGDCKCTKEQEHYNNSKLSDKYIRDMNFKIPSNPFILDFDLDYFNTRDSLNPKEKDIISRLIKDSEFITIAREKEYFDALKKEDFEVEEAENELICLIEKCL